MIWQKGINNYPNDVVDAMQLTQTYRFEGGVIGDMVTFHRDAEQSAYIIEEYEHKNKNKNKNKQYKRKAEGDPMTENKEKKIKILSANSAKVAIVGRTVPF